MYIKSPGAGAAWGTFVEPFTSYMWFCTIAMIILGSFVISVTYYVGTKFNGDDEGEELRFDFGSVLFICFSAFAQQGKYGYTTFTNKFFGITVGQTFPRSSA